MSLAFATKIKDQSLSQDVEQWLAAQEAKKVEGEVDRLPSGYVQLPVGFTKFKDGIIPISKKKEVKSEAQSLADIEKTNTLVREQKKLNRSQLRQSKKQSNQERRAQQLAEQRILYALFKAQARRGDLIKLSEQTGVLVDVLSGLTSKVMRPERWARVKPILENFHAVNQRDSDCVMGFTQRSKHNRQKMDAAIESGANVFIGICVKHGEADHHYCWRENRNHYRFWCSVCRKERYEKSRKPCVPCDENGQRFLSEESKQEHLRRLGVREAKQAALLAGLKEFEAVCKTHGSTKFFIMSNGKPRCILCHKLVQKTKYQNQRKSQVNQKMTNNQKIESAQAHKAQLVESCKHCLNCTAWVPELTDWDVMQSGYGDEQLYPQQFNLTIEQMRQILDNAPDGATAFMNLEDDEYSYYAKFTPEWSKQNKHAYWAKGVLTGEYRWFFMANMFGGHDLTCGLIELSDLQKHVDQYAEVTA